MRTITLRSRIILGFGVVTVPLLLLLLFNNWYAIRVVREQVAASNQNIVKMYGNQVDGVLMGLDKYLLSSAMQNPDLISLNSYPEDSMEAYFAKTNTLNKLEKDITYYNATEAFFAYGTKDKELLFASQQHVGYEQKQSMKAKLEVLLEDPPVRERMIHRWLQIDMDGGSYMLKLMDSGYGSYIGAWIDLNRLLKPMRLLEFGDKASVLFATASGLVLTRNSDDSLSDLLKSDVLEAALTDTGKAYSLIKSGTDGSAAMLVSRPSEVADLVLAVLLPENILLEKLPAFQRLVYVTPVMAAAALLIFLLYLQRSIALPVHKLLKGMRKIQSGNLSARLEPTHLAEFNAINDTFNSMAEEIKHLKLDIYEEQINTQKAELRHLQAQIHPHFFMNCLNLIYNLAQVKNVGLVQKLAIHLVRHFRFITRTNAASVALSEELEHVRNYLNIQKVRFPEALDFRIDMEPEIGACSVPPLIIQPFVENAMEHGFKYMGDEPFTIRVQAGIDPDSPDKLILVQVADNGKGFAPELLARLGSGDYFREDVDGHIGIWNVHNRCRLFYRTPVPLTFANRSRGGAVIELRLPLVIDM